MGSRGVGDVAVLWGSLRREWASALAGDELVEDDVRAEGAWAFAGVEEEPSEQERRVDWAKLQSVASLLRAYAAEWRDVLVARSNCGCSSANFQAASSARILLPM